MNRFSAQDYPSDQTKGRSCSSCGDGWFWQVTIFVIDCYDVRDEDDGDGDGDGDGDDGGDGDCDGNLYDSDHKKNNANTNMLCSITLLPTLRPKMARF